MVNIQTLFCRFQCIDFAGRLALQHFEHEVLACHNAIAAQYLFDGLAGKFGMIVLLAEMTQPDMTQGIGGIFCQRLTTGGIAKMTIRTKNAILEILGIWPLQKHLLIMICL